MEMRSNKNIRIGDVLKEFGYVTDEDISAALEYSKTHEGVRLGGALIEMNIITEKQMLEEKALHGQSVVVMNDDGKIIHIPASQVLADNEIFQKD